MTEISNANSMVAMLHCALCLDEWKANEQVNRTMSPRDWAELEVGWTRQGIQVWCKRHECNVVHMDFEGRKVKANTTRATATK